MRAWALSLLCLATEASAWTPVKCTRAHDDAVAGRSNAPAADECVKVCRSIDSTLAEKCAGLARARRCDGALAGLRDDPTSAARVDLCRRLCEYSPKKGARCEALYACENAARASREAPQSKALVDACIDGCDGKRAALAADCIERRAAQRACDAAVAGQTSVAECRSVCGRTGQQGRCPEHDAEPVSPTAVPKRPAEAASSPAASQPIPREESVEPEAGLPWPWIVTGGGAMILGGAAIVWGYGSGYNDDIRRSRSGSERADLIASRDAAYDWRVGLGIGGGVVLTAGLVWLIVDLTTDDAPERAADGGSNRGFGVFRF